MGVLGDIGELYRDNGKENGIYYLGIGVKGFKEYYSNIMVC